MRWVALLILVFLGVRASAVPFSCPASSADWSDSEIRARMESPRFWSLCTEVDQSRVQLLTLPSLKNLLPAQQYTKIEAAAKLGLAPLAQQPLVKVSSELVDLKTGKVIQVSGVGALIAVPQERRSLLELDSEDVQAAGFWVLTAGHLAKGRNLKIFGSDESPLPIREAYYTDQEDLSLIRVDERMFIPRAPLAYFDGDSSLLTYLRQGTNSLKDPHFDFTLNLLPAEGVFGVLREAASAFILIPSWLKVPVIQDPQSIFDHALPRGDETTVTVVPQSFPAGFSGAPLVTQRSLVGWGPVFEITGVLSLSRGDRPRSLYAGKRAILELMKRGIEARAETESASWALFDGQFVRLWKDKTVEVFRTHNPVGNGITIDGRKPEVAESGAVLLDVLKPGMSFDEFTQALRDQGYRLLIK